jgi:RNA polymerase sigma-70 factor (ECF subfamily)
VARTSVISTGTILNKRFCPKGRGGLATSFVATRDIRSMGDVDLVEALAGESEEALREIYRRHASFVRSVARRPLRRTDLAEEAVQDVFLQLWAAPARFDPGRGSLRAYLRVQAYRRAIDVSRAESSRRRREEHDARWAPPGAADPEEAVIDLTTAHQVRRAVAALSPQERQAIELAYFAGHSYRQVAELLGQPEGTVKNRIRVAMRRLRGVLPRVAGAGGAMAGAPVA